MGSENWIRARSAEQIEQRTRMILEAAQRLFEVHRYEEITLIMIAEEAGFTRSNLYRYFATKEEVFLEILKNDLTVWVNQIQEWLIRGGFSAADFGTLWVDTMLANSRMLRILAILTTKLEPNCSLEALVSFKRHVSSLQNAVIDSLLLALPKLNPEAAREFIYFQSSLAIGTYPAMNPTDKQKDAMQAAEIPFDPETYRIMMINAVNHVVSGLMETCI